MERCVLRMRMSLADAHYGGELVSGARLLELFGDAATELLIRHDGDEGLFKAYDNVEFMGPVYAGDYLEVKAEISRVGNTSRAMNFEVWKYIEAEKGAPGSSAARVLAEPKLVAKASGTCVVPKDKQRKVPG